MAANKSAFVPRINGYVDAPWSAFVLGRLTTTSFTGRVMILS